ncbi:MAG: hypothetical protein H8E87_03495 [FCB group bacterium]|nr:hypothetical protein [FCB group bacterium]
MLINRLQFRLFRFQSLPVISGFVIEGFNPVYLVMFVHDENLRLVIKIM